jgi:hypothetical protein
MFYTIGVPLYLIIGLIWSIYTILRNQSTHKSHREHWFTAGFFSFMLWPILVWTAWANGFIQQDIRWVLHIIGKRLI